MLRNTGKKCYSATRMVSLFPTSGYHFNAGANHGLFRSCPATYYLTDVKLLIRPWMIILLDTPNTFIELSACT
jgi:hypothetical protein